MKKLYFGVLFLCIIIGVALSFAAYSHRGTYEGLTTGTTGDIKCTNYFWTPSSYQPKEPSANYAIWAMKSMGGNIIVDGISFPKGYTPTCERAKVIPCTVTTSWVCQDTTKIVNGSIQWVKFDNSQNKLEFTTTAPNDVPSCNNTPPPVPTPTPPPSPNVLPPWKTFSLGILDETKQNINNMIQAEANKVKSVALK